MSDFRDELNAYTQGERDRGGNYRNPFDEDDDLYQFYDDGYWGRIFYSEDDRL